VDRALVTAGVIPLLVGPLTSWSLRYALVQHAGSVASAPDWALLWLPFTGVATVAGGWLTIGAGLRPFGHAAYGVLIAAGLYLYTGLLWVFWFNLSLGAPPTGMFLLAAVLLALIWPLQVAQALGLFGLSFN